MRYLIIDSSFIELARFDKSINQLYLEVDDKGVIKREIGLNTCGDIVHAYPSKKYRYGKYGILDLNCFDIKSEDNELLFDDFEKKWNQIM
jgi:hypothetical protein